MEIERSIKPRLIGLVALCAMLAGAIGYAVTWRSALPLMATNDAALVRAWMDRGERARCERAPASWSLRTDEGVELWAYDPATDTSANPQAPPLDMQLRKQLRAGAPHPMRLYFVFMEPVRQRDHGGAALMRAGPEGPCALVQMHWPLRRGARLQVGVLFVLVVLSACAGFTALLIGRALVRPLLERIDTLHQAAQRVGAGPEPLALEPGPPDELGQIARALRDADARIRDDAPHLAQRRRGLERHNSEIAHDLRTPMTSMSLALEALDEGELAAPQRDALGLAVQEIAYMRALIDNLRLATELREDPQAGRRQREELDLSELLEQTARRERVIARRRDVSLEIALPDEPVLLDADRTMLAQALTNLVQNAVTYNDPGGHVALLLEPHAQGWRLVVLDDGPGVPPEVLEDLRAPTFRTDEARQRHPHGDGLGLAITQAVCQRHGWTLELEPNHPRGLRATIVFAS